MKVNKYYPFAFIYFFVNSVGLPFGLLYTMILTPVFFIYILTNGKRWNLFIFPILVFPFMVFQLRNGVDQYNYFRSVVIYLTVFIFCLAFITFLRKCDDLEGIFKKLWITNFIFTIVALVLLVTPLKLLVWGDWSISVGSLAITDWPRLSMLTYEPSYYGTLMLPLFAFCFVKFILATNDKGALRALLMISLPIALSLSMGVIAGITITTVFFFLLNANKFLTSKKLLFSLTTLLFAGILFIVMLVIFFPNNPLFVRVTAIFAGADGSANGRTFEAMQLGYIIADLKSIWWGIGPGQLKIIGDSVIKEFYRYPPDYGQVSIPSTFAETLALFGIIGASLRILVEIYLFFKTKVMSNYFRLFLFIYMFIYQFTGSFTTNIAEYVVWILAFINVFPQFDKASQIVKAEVPINESVDR